MNEIKVSVISPIYNTPEKMLRNNIEHLISQTLKEIEIILVDDGSKKETADICDEYAKKDNRIVVIHQKNRGLCGARNSGQKAAKGQYIAFVDGDDFLEYDALEAMYAKTDNGKNDVVVACIIKDFGIRLKEYDYSKFEDGKTYRGDECKYLQEKVLDFTANISQTGAKLYRKSFLKKNSIEHKEVLRQGAEGLEFMIRVFEYSDTACFLKNNCYHYMYNPESITEKHDEKNHERVIACFEEIENEIQKSDNYKRLHEALLTRLQYVIVTSAISGYFSPTNDEGYFRAKRKYYAFIETHKLLTESLEINSRIDKKRRIIILMIRTKMCFGLKILGGARKRQKGTIQ